MLKELNRDQAQLVAVLAKAARTQRDAFIAGVPDNDLAERSARGELNPTSAMGFTALSGGRVAGRYSARSH